MIAVSIGLSSSNEPSRNCFCSNMIVSISILSNKSNAAVVETRSINLRFDGDIVTLSRSINNTGVIHSMVFKTFGPNVSELLNSGTALANIIATTGTRTTVYKSHTIQTYRTAFSCITFGKKHPKQLKNSSKTTALVERVERRSNTVYQYSLPYSQSVQKLEICTRHRKVPGQSILTN